MNLDEHFGPLIPPRGTVERWEREFKPVSLSCLNAKSAKFLKEAMDEILAGWLVGKVLTDDVLIIWLVDRDGEVRFAVEELVHDGRGTGRPKHQTLPLTTTSPKLGHPALIDAERARIGGEIYLDWRVDPARWIINNKSGRYGRHSSRKREHLANVARKFKAHGIELDLEFVETT